MIGALYRYEQIMRDRQLEGEQKLAYRTQHSEPVVKAFWAWCDDQCHRSDLLPSSPLAKALKYAMARKASLEVFLADPAVPIDTNHLERGLRVIPTGKKNGLFCWTEIGAERVGIIQSATPTIVLFEWGLEVARQTGYDGDALRFWEWLEQHLSLPAQVSRRHHDRCLSSKLAG